MANIVCVACTDDNVHSLFNSEYPWNQQHKLHKRGEKQPPIVINCPKWASNNPVVDELVVNRYGMVFDFEIEVAKIEEVAAECKRKIGTLRASNTSFTMGPFTDDDDQELFKELKILHCSLLDKDAKLISKQFGDVSELSETKNR